jgi:hypothetical protein
MCTWKCKRDLLSPYKARLSRDKPIEVELVGIILMFESYNGYMLANRLFLLHLNYIY